MGAGGRAGPQAESCAPQNERENTSYDVATLQDEEGELPEFPGETPPAFPLPTPTPHHVWGPRSHSCNPQAWREVEVGREPSRHSQFMPFLEACLPWGP